MSQQPKEDWTEKPVELDLLKKQRESMTRLRDVLQQMVAKDQQEIQRLKEQLSRIKQGGAK